MIDAETMSEEDVRAHLRAFVGKRKQCEVAKDLGVSEPWLCYLLKGQRRPSGKVLDALGIVRHKRGRPFASNSEEKPCFRLKASA